MYIYIYILYQNDKEIKPSYQVLRVVQAADCNTRLHETLST